MDGYRELLLFLNRQNKFTSVVAIKLLVFHLCLQHLKTSKKKYGEKHQLVGSIINLKRTANQGSFLYPLTD